LSRLRTLCHRHHHHHHHHVQLALSVCTCTRSHIYMHLHAPLKRRLGWDFALRISHFARGRKLKALHMHVYMHAYLVPSIVRLCAHRQADKRCQRKVSFLYGLTCKSTRRCRNSNSAFEFCSVR
jgi:hypothetical protein